MLRRKTGPILGEGTMAATAIISGDDLAERLTHETLNILGAVSVRWNISDEATAGIASLSLMGYLRRLNGYDEKPLPQEIVHRITVLGLIDRTLSKEEASEWASTPNEMEPFLGQAPIDVLPKLDFEALAALHERMSANGRRPALYAIPTP